MKVQITKACREDILLAEVAKETFLSRKKGANEK